MTPEHTSLLIVDDDMVDRMAVKRALKKGRMATDISEADSVHDAQRLTLERSYSCVLVDYRLPDGTALDFLEHLRSESVDIPTIVLTGQGDENIAVEIMKAGALDYVSKAQISPGYLSRTISNAIRIHRAELEARRANQQLRSTNLLLKAQNEQLESQKRQIYLQNLELIEASRLKSQFLASMSHELRTPLHAITGFSQILLQQTKGALSADQFKMVERILANGDNLLVLLNDLLDFSKVEAGKLSLESRPFNLGRLILSTIEELRSLAINKSLQLTGTLDLGDRTFVGDELRLKQVLTNLISNAIKFTEAGEITVKAVESEDNGIEISVVDTGIGIEPDQLSVIFDPFIQANQTNSRSHAGTGLGLAICRSLVEMMKGTITVNSTVGVGTTFLIYLPRQVS